MYEGQELTDSGSIATARWADPDYIADKYYFEPGDVWIGRNPHNWDSAIGYRDERHIMVCAGAGSGKGRSFIVNNLALYPGSTVTYDPKGELPFLMAARRGDGDHLCEGMGQRVFVLDPLERSGVDLKYLAYCDPISMLDPNDPELSTWCKRLARSLVKKKESGGDAQNWLEKAIGFIALVIEHVVTYGPIDDDKQAERSLHYIYQLILEGNVASHVRFQEYFKAFTEERNANLKDGEEPYPVQPAPDPYTILLDEMINNEDAGRFLPMEARKFKREMEEVPKFFHSVVGEAADAMSWLRSTSMEKNIRGWGDEARRFDPRFLKTDPQGVSVFIVMPVDDLDTYEPWLQSIFVGIFAAMREVRSKPRFPVLTFLDEFSSLGHQDYIAKSLDNIRGAGMKLAFIVQNFGKLKKLYGDEMESFFTNSGLELYFGKIGQTAIDYLKKELGETEIVKVARSQNRSENEGETFSEAVTYGESSTEGGSETMTDSTSQALSKGRNWNWSNGVNWTDSKNWGRSEGNSMGRNYGPHVFYQGLQHSKNYGTSLNHNSGRSHSKGGSRQRGGGRSENRTDTSSQSRAIGSSWSRTTNRSETTTKGKSRGYQIGEGVAESFHKKPLLDAHEINSFLRSLPESDRDHPAYPGMMLVRIHGEDPFFVRRSHYDQDPYFERCFSADPIHGFLPLPEQALLGHQYTEDHIFEVTLPKMLVEEGFQAEAMLRPHQTFEAGQELFSYRQADGKTEIIGAPVRGRVLDVSNEDTENGRILTLRSSRALTDQHRLKFKKAAYTKPIKAIKDREAKKRAAEAAERKRAALKAWTEYAEERRQINRETFQFDGFVGALRTWTKSAEFDVLTARWRDHQDQQRLLIKDHGDKPDAVKLEKLRSP